MLRSFRLKMILLASAVCASTLVGFGLIMWSLFHTMEQGRMDREIQHLTLRSLQFGPPHQLLREEGLLILGEEISEVGMALVSEEELKVHTPLWPEELVVAQLPRPEPLAEGLEGAFRWPPRWPGRSRGERGPGPGGPPPPGPEGPLGPPGPGADGPAPSDDAVGEARGRRRSGARREDDQPRSPDLADGPRRAPAVGDADERPRRDRGARGDTAAVDSDEARARAERRRERMRRRRGRFFRREVPQETFDQAVYTDYQLESGPWRVGSYPIGSGYTLHTAVNLSTFEARASQVHHMFLAALGIVFVVAGGGGWWIARRALKPVTALGDAAEQITAAHLDRRIPEVGADEEFARLIRVFNAMLGRLEGSYLQAVRFSADASHELKTPLAVIQGEVETALSSVADGSEAQAALGSILEEIQRLKMLMHALLVFSRLDAGTLQLQRQPFDLAACVRETCEDSQELAPELRFEVELPEGALQVEADPSLLPSVVRNLIGNASKYNQPDGWVEVSLRVEGGPSDSAAGAPSAGRAVLRVANSGPEIAAEHREQIFDRFFRADPSRTGGSHGLGLSLAREFARAHGGEVSLVSSDAEGTVFELTLETAPGPQAS